MDTGAEQVRCDKKRLHGTCSDRFLNRRRRSDSSRGHTKDLVSDSRRAAIGGLVHTSCPSLDERGGRWVAIGGGCKGCARVGCDSMRLGEMEMYGFDDCSFRTHLTSAL